MQQLTSTKNTVTSILEKLTSQSHCCESNRADLTYEVKSPTLTTNTVSREITPPSLLPLPLPRALLRTRSEGLEALKL